MHPSRSSSCISAAIVAKCKLVVCQQRAPFSNIALNLMKTICFFSHKMQNEKPKQLEYARKNSYQRSSIRLHDVRAEICAENQLDQSFEGAQQREDTFVQRMWQKVNFRNNTHISINRMHKSHWIFSLISVLLVNHSCCAIALSTPM